MKTTFTFDDVRRIGLALPGVEESTTYRGPSLKIRGKLLTCPAINKSAEPVSISHIDADALRGLLRMSWQFVTQENSARTRQARKPKSSRLKRAIS
jgi:hypothetical protein